MSKQEHRSREPRPEPSFLRKFRLELLAGLFFGLGLFLLLERLEIKQIMFRACKWLLAFLRDVVSFPLDIISHTQRSDIVGIIFLVLALLIIGARFRFRMIERQQVVDVDERCPKCQNDLTRMHRKLIHRLLQLVFRVRITLYACEKCRFQAAVWAGRQ